MTRGRLRHLSPRTRRLLVYVVLVLVASGGLWRVETTARSAEDTADAVEAEAEARRIASCDQALAIRAEQEQLLVDIVTGFRGRPQIVEAIRQSYRELPTPVPCASQGGAP